VAQSELLPDDATPGLLQQVRIGSAINVKRQFADYCITLVYSRTAAAGEQQQILGLDFGLCNSTRVQGSGP
jgi:hypothetical protein